MEPGKGQADGRTVPQIINSLQIGLDDYDDVFSDFDTAPYATRLLSDDLIKEMRKHHSETKKGQFVVLFTLPKAQRSQKVESVIRKRLKEYFKAQLDRTEGEADSIRNNGFLRVGAGFALSLPLFLFPGFEDLPILSLLPALFWYLAWSGFERILDESRVLRRKKRFFENFMSAQYNFSDAESVAESIALSTPSEGA